MEPLPSCSISQRSHVYITLPNTIVKKKRRTIEIEAVHKVDGGFDVKKCVLLLKPFQVSLFLVN